MDPNKKMVLKKLSRQETPNSVKQCKNEIQCMCEHSMRDHSICDHSM